MVVVDEAHCILFYFRMVSGIRNAICGFEDWLLLYSDTSKYEVEKMIKSIERQSTPFGVHLEKIRNDLH